MDSRHLATTFRIVRDAAVATSIALAIPAAPADAQPAVSLPQSHVAPRSHVAVLVGSGSWLPQRHHPLGWNDDGSRAVLALQLERPFRSSSWSWAVGVAGAVVPGACMERCAESGVLVDVAMLRQLDVPGDLAFVYGGGGAGVAHFRETRVGPGARVGVGLGLRHGLRVEGRYQYLAGASEPHARMLAAGLHLGW